MKDSPVVTVSGPPGSGTTTLCRLLEQRLEVPYTYAGRIFRDEAKRRGMDLAAFGALCQEDPAVDQALDDEQVKLLRGAGGPGLVLEGRLSGWLAHRNGIPALKVFVACDEEERIRRIVERDGDDAGTQHARTLEREASEADRYQRYYDIDVADLSIYDLVLDSTRTPPDELADQVVAVLGDTV